MANSRIFAGTALLNMRRRQKLKQGEMAARLGISPAYLSQLENDLRPLTEALTDQLRAMYPADWLVISRGRQSTLLEAFEQAAGRGAADAKLTTTQMRRLAEQYPEFVRRFVDLDTSHRQMSERLAMLDEAIGADNAASGRLPWEEVRDWFHHANNYVDLLDRRAEQLAGDIAGGRISPDLGQLSGWLEGVGVDVTRRSGVHISTYEPENRRLVLDTAQTEESVRFHLASQIAHFALADEIDAIVGEAQLRTQTARNLLTVGLRNYAAGAMILPYGNFAAAAQEMRHDIDRLRWTFGASFEQVCHRLSTLQRPGLSGTPMFFCRVDLAGNITKRHSATRLQFARFGGACPLWIVHEAVAVPERIHVQLAEMPDGARYISIARGLVKPSRSYSPIPRRYALALGCETRFAADFVYADGIDLEAEGAAQAIGISCRICPREGCDQRAYPPNDRGIAVTPQSRGIVPYTLTPAAG